MSDYTIYALKGANDSKRDAKTCESLKKGVGRFGGHYVVVLLALLTNPRWRNRALYNFLLPLLGLFCLLPSYTKAQSVDNKTITNSKGIAMVYVAFDASLTRFDTPLDGRTKNATSTLGVTLGAGTAFDTFLNGVFKVSVYEVDEPIHPSFDFVSETQIWSFMGGLKLQDPNQGISWDLLFGLSSHVYNFEGVDLGDEGRRDGFAMSTSMNIPIVRLKNTPVIAFFGARKVFNEDTGHIHYSLGLKGLQIFTR